MPEIKKPKQTEKDHIPFNKRFPASSFVLVTLMAVMGFLAGQNSSDKLEQLAENKNATMINLKKEFTESCLQQDINTDIQSQFQKKQKDGKGQIVVEFDSYSDAIQQCAETKAKQHFDNLVTKHKSDRTYGYGIGFMGAIILCAAMVARKKDQKKTKPLQPPAP